MISVLINWSYIGLTSYIIGYSLLLLFEKKEKHFLKEPIACMMMGLVFAAVYSQFFSLVAGVGMIANLIYIGIAIVVFGYNRQSICGLLCECMKKKWYIYLGVMTVVLLMSYGTSRGYMHFDSLLYHAQAIRWIEEYGVVPGLGNLHSRFAYNSAAFPMTALFSMKDVFGQSLHAVVGFMALLLAFEASKIYKIFSHKRIGLSDFGRIGAIYYLFIIFTEMMSPASDYYAMIGVFYVVIKWMELEEQKINKVESYGLLCIYMVFVVSLKLSTAPLLLLVIKPAVLLIREKKYRQIVVYLLTGIVAIAPFLIRNIILSGWLVYPFTFIDICSVDWKIPKVMADYDSKEIQVYGRLLYDLNLYDLTILEWGPNWFRSLVGLEKIWVLLSGICTVVGGIGVTIAGIYGVSTWKNKGEKELWSLILLEITLIISYIFWQMSAPLVRYGYVYLLLLPLGTFGILYMVMEQRKEDAKLVSYVVKWSYIGVVVVFSLFLLYKGKNLVTGIMSTAGQPYYMMQQDYTSCETEEYQLGEYTIYIPTESGQIGYDKFPSSPFEMLIELRGEALEEGFIYTGQ